MGDPTAIELLEEAIADLEGKLNLAPGEDPPLIASNNTKQPKKQKKKNPAKQNNKPQVTPQIDPNLPDICKLEFKVGQITKVWVHPDADKLYCEEIDVGEKDGPRQIASL